jgi:plasmid stabilization system protein ParE
MRFTFTQFAAEDIDGLALHLQGIPEVPALKIGRQIQDAFNLLTVFPRLGRVDLRLSNSAGRSIFRYNIGRYACFYLISGSNLVILGLIHGARDVDTIMRQRVG